MTSLAWSFMTSFLTYETNKSVVVKSWSVGIINRLVQLMIISYFVGYVFLYERAYQVADTSIESSVITKVKGFGKVNDVVMDVADYIYPPQGEGVFSIITKIITTHNQFQGTCSEIGDSFNCSTNADCAKHLSSVQANGIITGVCNTSCGSCEIEGWCPAENDQVQIEPMAEFVNFTIYIKNSIRFPLFSVTRGNFNATIKNCTNNKLTDPFCPIFRVGDILTEINQNVTTLANNGGEIGIIIEWRCNLDQDVDLCVPSYSFIKLNAPFENYASKGYNFRFAKYYKTADGTDFRSLHKAYAVRFDVMVTGTARKFSLIPTVINVIAALTSIGMVSEAQILASITPSPGSQMSVRRGHDSCCDSGAISLSVNY